MENNITVAYNVKDWSNDGTHYNQRVRISKGLIKAYNDYVIDYTRNNVLTGNEKRYLKPIEIANRVYLKLTETRHMHKFLELKGVDVDRLKLNRNTMLDII